MKKECEVVMLPTKKATWPNCIWLGRISKQLRLDKSYRSYYSCDPIDDSMLPQHLYVVSNDDEIKVGDLVFVSEHVIGSKYSISRIDSLDDIKGLNAKKIIATTDISLTIDNFKFGYGKYLPRPSESFIKKYIKEFNRGYQIKEVMVEYEAAPNEFDNPMTNPLGIDNFEGAEWEVKANNNNEVIITKVKDSWSKGEVSRIVSEFAKDFSRDNRLDFKSSFDYTMNWINRKL